MVGKLQVTSTGYDPSKPPPRDLTLAPSGTIPAHNSESKEVALRPVGRRLLVVPVDQGTVPDRLIHIEVGTLAKELRLCAVLAVGPKVAATHAQLKPGVAVWVKPFFGTEAIVNGHSVLFIMPEDVCGIANLRG